MPWATPVKMLPPLLRIRKLPNTPERPELRNLWHSSSWPCSHCVTRPLAAVFGACHLRRAGFAGASIDIDPTP
jgi:hypothetical protein